MILVLWAPPLWAADVDDLYVGEAVAADQSEQARAEALEAALGRVLVRVSGDPDILQHEAAAPLLSRAPDWVLSYGYETVPEAEVAADLLPPSTDETLLDTEEVLLEKPALPVSAEEVAEIEEIVEEKVLLLRARFDGSAVQQALRREGLPVWGRERPRTLVLLAIEGEADIVSARAADELARAMRETAGQRGIPLVFPLRGDDERRAIRAADIRYGTLENIRATADTYGASHVLIGRLAPAGGGWRAEWSLSHRGETVAEWRGGGGERGGVLADGARRLADTYARRFAVYGGADADTVIALAVDGVTAIGDYVRVGRYLRGLTAVETAIPVLVDREAVVFRVQLSGDASVLRRNIELADWLREDELARNLAALYAAGGRALGYRIGSS